MKAAMFRALLFARQIIALSWCDVHDGSRPCFRAWHLLGFEVLRILMRRCQCRGEMFYGPVPRFVTAVSAIRFALAALLLGCALGGGARWVMAYELHDLPTRPLVGGLR